MSQAREQPTHPGPEDQPPSDTTIEDYVRAVEGLEADRLAGPAAALAELLEARLGGADAPEARRVLDGLLADSGHATHQPGE